MDENLATIQGLKAETYAKYVEWYAEYRQMSKHADAFVDLLPSESIYTAATPEGVLIGYKQAVAQIEPQFNERADALKR